MEYGRGQLRYSYLMKGHLGFSKAGGIGCTRNGAPFFQRIPDEPDLPICFWWIQTTKLDRFCLVLDLGAHIQHLCAYIVSYTHVYLLVMWFLCSFNHIEDDDPNW